jgi:hypothetical protein
VLLVRALRVSYYGCLEGVKAGSHAQAVDKATTAAVTPKPELERVFGTLDHARAEPKPRTTMLSQHSRTAIKPVRELEAELGAEPARTPGHDHSGGQLAMNRLASPSLKPIQRPSHSHRRAAPKATAKHGTHPLCSRTYSLRPGHEPEPEPTPETQQQLCTGSQCGDRRQPCGACASAQINIVSTGLTTRYRSNT